MTLSPRTAAVLMLMIGFIAAWNTIIPALVLEWTMETSNRASDS